MKNIKLGIRLLLIYIVVGLLPLLLLNALDIIKAKDMMRSMQSHIIEEKLSGDIRAMQTYLHDSVGEITLANDELVGQDGEKISDQEALIDKISSELNVVATVFIKDSKGYCRVLTSIVDQETGQRIVGTYLDNTSDAFRTIEEDKQYIGSAEIQNNAYTTVYEPLKDSSGQTIGILFAGVSLEKSNELLNKQATGLVINTMIMFIILMILGMVIMYFVSHSLTKPMIAITKEAERVARLDLSEKIDETLTDRGDEIGKVAKSMDSILASLTEVICSSNEISEHVVRTSSDLENTCEEASRATEEMARTVQEIAGGATAQAQNTTQCMQQLEDLGAMIDNNGKKINVLDQRSKQVSTLTDEGKKILEELASKIHISNEATIKAYDNMEKTNRSAQQISAASNVIASIAEQTNLLALNASIEAARAGEHGKGFAVVAEEIRKLAEQSASSTQMIDEQIIRLQNDVRGAVKVTEQVKEMLYEQNNDVKVTESKYTDIAGAVDVMRQAVEELIKTGKEMAVGKAEVGTNIESLSAVAEENAAATEEASACIEEQSASLHTMYTSATEMNNKAKDLQQLINKFKL